MKRIIYVLSLVGLTGCAQSGYSPSYIISDAAEEVCCSAAPIEELGE
jgi:hypothetical protein